MATDEQIKSRPTLNLKQRTFRHELNMYLLIYRYSWLFYNRIINKFKSEDFEDHSWVKKWMIAWIRISSIFNLFSC